MKKYLSENVIKDRLKNLTLTQKREFNNLLKQLYLERFLVRLAQSMKKYMFRKIEIEERLSKTDILLFL